MNLNEVCSLWKKRPGQEPRSLPKEPDATDILENRMAKIDEKQYSKYGAVL